MLVTLGYVIISITTNSTLNILKCLSPNSDEALSFYEGLVSIYDANCLLEAMHFLKNVKWIVVENVPVELSNVRYVEGEIFSTFQILAFSDRK